MKTRIKICSIKFKLISSLNTSIDSIRKFQIRRIIWNKFSKNFKHSKISISHRSTIFDITIISIILHGRNTCKSTDRCSLTLLFTQQLHPPFRERVACAQVRARLCLLAGRVLCIRVGRLMSPSPPSLPLIPRTPRDPRRCSRDNVRPLIVRPPRIYSMYT